MKIGILQTGHAIPELHDELGEYADLFERLLDGHDFSFNRYNVVDGIFPGSVEAADGWLITGSKHGAYDDLPWIAELETFIRAIRDDGRPLVGGCLGHQIIAQALGGKVEKFHGGWAVGFQDYEFDDGTHMRLDAWHQDQVTRVPEGARVTASNDFCENAGLLIGDTIMTIQPHPEFTSRVLELLIAHRGPGVVPDELLKRAGEGNNQANDSKAYAQKIAKFFKDEAKHG